MAGAGGGVGATDEIPEVEMEVAERAPGEPGRVGSKRVRDSASALDSYGFYGVTTAEKKPMLQPHNVNKTLNKAGNSNLLHMDSGGASKMGRYLHGPNGLGTPDSNALRLNISSSGENLGNETQWDTKICTFYTQGWCNKVNSCAFLHGREGLGFAKAGLLAPAGFENHRGSEEGSQVQHQSNLKVPQFKDAEDSSKNELYRSLIHAYGEDNEKLTHIADKRNSTTPVISQGLHVTGIIEQSLVVHGKNHKPFMRHHTGLSPETYLDGRGILLDGGKFQSGMDRRNSLSNAHVARTYLDVNNLNSGHQFRSSGLSISSYPFQLSEKLSAYGATTENLPNTRQKEHHSSHASYSSRSLTGFKNPGYDTSEISLGSPTLQTTPQLGVQSHQLFTTGIEKVNLHRYIDVDKGCGTSRPALLSSSSSEPYLMSAGPLSPIKDEVWVTSVPFVPSFSLPDCTTPPGSQYDPFVDCIEPPKGGDTNNLKSSNVSFSTSSQHTNQYVITDESLKRGDKLTRNMSAKGANGPAYLIASDRGQSSSLDDSNRLKARDRKIGAATDDEKARDFRFHLAEHIKELIKPIWKEGNLSKDAHKLVVKKSIEKIVDSIGPNQIPTTEELIAKYIATSGSKIEKLVKAYVDRHRTT